jgi:hypothetical protein
MESMTRQKASTALLFFTEYLFVSKVFQLSNNKKAGSPYFHHGKLGSPLRFNLELKLVSRFSGAGTSTLPLNQSFK